MNRTIDILTCTSVKQQSAYGTALGNTDLTFAHPFTGEDFIKEAYTKANNAESYGKGHEFATGKQVNLTSDTTCSRTFDGSSAALGWVAAFALGDVSLTELSPGTVFEHTIKMMDVSDPAIGKQLPAATWVEQKADYSLLLYRDMVMKGFKITGALGKQIQVQFDMTGSGWWETSTLPSFPALQQVSFLRTADVTIDIGGTDVSATIKDFTFQYTNELADAAGYHPGSPKLLTAQGGFQVRGHCLVKKRTVTLNFKMRMDNNNIRQDNLLNTERAITITATGDEIEPTFNHSMAISIPKAEFSKADIGTDDGAFIYDCEVLLKWDDTLNAPFEIVIVNDIPEYLALPA